MWQGDRGRGWASQCDRETENRGRATQHGREAGAEAGHLSMAGRWRDRGRASQRGRETGAEAGISAWQGDGGAESGISVWQGVGGAEARYLSVAGSWRGRAQASQCGRETLRFPSNSCSPNPKDLYHLEADESLGLFHRWCPQSKAFPSCPPKLKPKCPHRPLTQHPRRCRNPSCSSPMPRSPLLISPMQPPPCHSQISSSSLPR